MNTSTAPHASRSHLRTPLQPISNRKVPPSHRNNPKIEPPQQDHDQNAALSRLYTAHTTLVRALEQVDSLVLKAHKLGLARKITAKETDRFVKSLTEMGSLMQEWVPFFEEAARRPTLPVCDDGTRCENAKAEAAPLTLSVGEDLFPIAGIEEAGKDGEAERCLSDSPLVPGLEKAQFVFTFAASGNLFDELLAVPPALAMETTNDLIPSPTNSVPMPSPTLLEPQSSPEMELVTPEPPRSLLKKYSGFFSKVDHSAAGRKDSPMILATPRLAESPPKTCMLMKPSSNDDYRVERDLRLDSSILFLKSPFRTPASPPKTCKLMKPTSKEKATERESNLETPMIFLKSPFRTPGIYLRPAASIKNSPSTAVKELPLESLRKPGQPQPGEQTLKKELWRKIEANFADVCKSLFPDTDTDIPSGSSNGRNLLLQGNYRGSAK